MQVQWCWGVFGLSRIGPQRFWMGFPPLYPCRATPTQNKLPPVGGAPFRPTGGPRTERCGRPWHAAHLWAVGYPLLPPTVGREKFPSATKESNFPAVLRGATKGAGGASKARSKHPAQIGLQKKGCAKSCGFCRPIPAWPGRGKIGRLPPCHPFFPPQAPAG